MAKRKPTQIVQVGTRMPESLRLSLDKAAKAREVSLNAEIVHRLEESFRRESAEEMLAEAKRIGANTQELLNDIRQALPEELARLLGGKENETR
jgi:hypothetical protein